EEGKAHHVVVIAVVTAAFEESVSRVRLDEVTLASVHEPEPHSASHGARIPRHPEVLIRDREAIDLVVPHATILWKDHFHVISANLKLAAKPEDDLTKTAGLRHRGTLRGNHHDVHGPPPRSPPRPGGTPSRAPTNARTP